MQQDTIQHFGTAPDGSPVWRVRLENGGTTAWVMSWGASLQDLRIAGMAQALILGSPDFTPYLDEMIYFGAVVGRVANRIAQGRAVLDGRVLELERNEAGRTTLHGGSQGTGQANWRFEGHDATSCALSIRLPDGLGGFPGTLDLSARYSLDAAGALTLALEAQTDAPTFCNIAPHAYWTLGAAGGLSDHRLRVAAETYLPTDAAEIPLGHQAPVAGTRFDFRSARAVMAAGDAPLNHNLCLSGTPALRPVCWLTHGAVTLEVATDAIGLQLYDGIHIDSGALRTHTGQPYRPHAGLAIEPQAWPDAPNQPDFPSVILRPGARWTQVSRFSLTRTPEPGQ